MKYEFIQAQKACFPVEFMCEHLGVSRSGFYAWTRRAKSARQQQNEQLAEEVAQVHRDSRGRYGSPRVHAEMKARDAFGSFSVENKLLLDSEVRSSN